MFQECVCDLLFQVAVPSEPEIGFAGRAITNVDIPVRTRNCVSFLHELVIDVAGQRRENMNPRESDGSIDLGLLGFRSYAKNTVDAELVDEHAVDIRMIELILNESHLDSLGSQNRTGSPHQIFEPIQPTPVIRHEEVMEDHQIELAQLSGRRELLPLHVAT